MKKMFIALLSLTALLSFSSAFALTMISAPILSSPTENTLSIDWDDVEGALGYYIYYSKDSGVTDGYDFEWVDLIESSETILENLEKNTAYYVAVTVVDDNGNESQFSPEASFTTGMLSPAVANSAAFALEGVTVLSANQIELSFNALLDDSDDAVRELRIVEKQSWSEVFVSETVLNNTDSMKLIATTDTDLVEAAQYDLTIISIEDMDKNNIESGIDGITTFVVPTLLTSSNEQIGEALVEVVDVTTEVMPDLDAAGTDTMSKQDEASKVGQVLSDEEIAKTAELAAQGNEALPETGSEAILLLLLAIILWWGLFFLNAKRA